MAFPSAGDPFVALFGAKTQAYTFDFRENTPVLWLRSLLLGLIGAIGYGIIHDQITVRICPEYLTKWHPKILETENPTLVALAWGVVATWWFGLILGAGLALFATVGRWPAAPWRWIVRSVIAVFVTAAFSATVAGLICWLGGFEANHDFFGPIFAEDDQAHWKAILVVGTIHTTSYIAAAVSAGIAGITMLVLRMRKSSARVPSREIRH